MVSTLWHLAIILRAPKVHRHKKMNNVYWASNQALLKFNNLVTLEKHMLIILTVKKKNITTSLGEFHSMLMIKHVTLFMLKIHLLA